MYSDFTLPDEILQEVLLAENRESLVIGGYANTDQCEVVLWTGKLKRFVVPFFEFETSGTGLEPDFENFSVIDYGQTLKFGEYEATVESLEMYYKE